MSLLTLPREIRDLIYDGLNDRVPIYILPKSGHPRLLVSQDSQRLLLVNGQLCDEHRQHLLRHARVVLCFDKLSVGRSHPVYPAFLTRRMKTLTAIIDLDGINPPNWSAKDSEPALNVILGQLIEYVELALSSFKNLEEVEIQWWNDLSVSEHASSPGEWTNALISAGLLRTQELWFGYLGGTLGDLKRLHGHIVSSQMRSDQFETRKMSPGGLRLLGDGGNQASQFAHVTPLSFF